MSLITFYKSNNGKCKKISDPIEMSCVPRIGETVYMHDVEYKIGDVCWDPFKNNSVNIILCEKKRMFKIPIMPALSANCISENIPPTEVSINWLDI